MKTTLYMKTLFVIGISFLTSYAIQAQNDTLKPSKSYLGVSLNVQGIIQNISPTMLKDQNFDFALVRFYLSEKSVLRFGLGIQTHAVERNSLDSINTVLVEVDSVNKQSGFYLSLAHEYHFKGNKRLDPYIGGMIAFGRMGRNTINYSLNQKDTIGESNYSVISDLPGSNLFRIGVISGFNYFIARDFSLGAEFMLTYNHISSGGDYSVVTIDKPVSGSEDVKRETGTRLNKTGYIGFSPLANITLTYFFNTKRK